MAKLERVLSQRLLKSKGSQSTRPIVVLCILGIAVCLVIITLATGITRGYRSTIEKKVIDMGSHIRISNYDLNYTFVPKPFNKDRTLLNELRKNPDIRHIQYFSTKVGIVKTENQVEGVVLKGIDSTFSWELFQDNLVAGQPLALHADTLTSGVIMSKKMVRKLQLKLGDKIFAYFVQDPPMQRRFFLQGIYETGMPEYDENFVLADLRHVQKLNGCGHPTEVIVNGDTVQGWACDSVGGIEILIHDYDKIDEVGNFVNHHIGYDLKAETIKEIYPAIFKWTSLIDTNTAVLLAITIFICVITLISTFFIIILEQTSTIGLLKALGMTTRRIRNVFMVIGLRIILLGMLLGNVLGVGLCLLQQHTHFVKLDPSAYYVAYVHVELNVMELVVVNVSVLVLCLLVLLLPASFVSKRITPVSAIKFE